MNSLENSEGIILKNPSQLNKRHTINRIILWRVYSLENLLSQSNHFLYRNIDAIAYSVIESIENMEIHNYDISILGFLGLEFSIFGKKEDEKLP